MALSLFIRGASSQLTGCSGKILSQPAFRLSSSALPNASRLRMVQPIHQLGNNNSQKPQSVLLKADYSVAAHNKIPTNPGAGSGTRLWVAEKIVGAALVGLFPAAIAFPCKPLDVLLAVSLVAHTYWGFEAIIAEYVREILFGPLVPKIAHFLLIAVTITTLGGLFYLIFDDIGLAAAVRRLWTIKPKQQ